MRLFRRWGKPTLQSLAATASVRTFGSVRTPLDVDLLVWAGGTLERTREALGNTLERLREQAPDGFVTFLVDGPEWEEALRAWTPRFPNRREVRLPLATDLPQLLYPLGIEGSAHAWVAFLWPGCGVSEEGLWSLRAAAREADLVYGDLAAPAPAEFFHPVQHGWLQMADLVPMHNCLLARRAFESIAGFDPSPLLRRTFWWDFTVRLSRYGRLIHAPVAPAPAAWEWSDFPFRPPEVGDPEFAARYMARGEEKNVESFLRDLPEKERERLARGLREWHQAREIRPTGAPFGGDVGAGLAPAREGTSPSPPSPSRGEGRRPLKVTLLSGLHDAHQNQLFFHSFFGKVAGRGLLTWRTILYERCRPEDLAGCDLAVFSRPRFPEVPALLDHCGAKGIPVLLMIDDNWLAAGREFPRFERLFTPGKPPFEVFLDGLRRADAVLVFNPLLEEDVRPFARRVLRLPASVDLSLFAAPPAPRQGGFLAGFAGSPRWEPSGFQGLARFLEQRADARLLIMAHEVPEELRRMPAERLTFVPWQHNYAAYARALAGLRPDVLIAPLDSSRFSASKIPIKFLESAAVGAAGVYSRVPPYTDTVREGETGLLVENAEQAWAAALERLHADPDLRSRIAENAGKEVRERFITERVLPEFLAVLQEVTGGR
ncbi:MAG TPA: glycosyltransferase [Thermoanaerobaculia bacterium]|jgi:glycosyltransferase involved in cell wall biosynthesis